MRRAFLRLFLATLARSPTRLSLAQHLHLAAQAREFIAHFQHRLVLLGHMPLEVGDLFFEALKVFVHRRTALRVDSTTTRP